MRHPARPGVRCSRRDDLGHGLQDLRRMINGLSGWGELTYPLVDRVGWTCQSQLANLDPDLPDEPLA